MYDTKTLDETLMHDREAVRKALEQYAQTLILALDENEGSDNDLNASLTQVESAMRVLWMAN